MDKRGDLFTPQASARQEAKRYLLHQVPTMGETDNIARQAEKASKTIFKEFGWTWHKLHNGEFDCVDLPRHAPKGGKHPADLVFYYDDPYEPSTVSVLTDVKSYGQSSITRASVTEALRSLCKSTDCACISPSFASTYQPDATLHETVGLLFIYNHDSGYEKSFRETLKTVDQSELAIFNSTQVYVLGPQQIKHLYTIAKHANSLRGEEVMKVGTKLQFFHTDTPRRKHLISRAASLESMQAPWMPAEFETPDDDRRFVVYTGYERDNEEDFVYLLDWICTRQILNFKNDITVFFVGGREGTATSFENAKTRYARACRDLKYETLRKRLERVHLETTPLLTPEFFSDAVGMEGRNE